MTVGRSIAETISSTQINVDERSNLRTEEGIIDDDQIIEASEIDIEIAECGEILERNGVPPSVPLVEQLWAWMESKRHVN